MMTLRPYKGYSGFVELDEDDGVLCGRLVGISDVVTFEAKDASKIVGEFHSSVDEYLSFCKERERQPEKPFSGRFVVRIDPDLHRRVTEAAQSAGISMNAWVGRQLQIAVESENWRQSHGAVQAGSVEPGNAGPHGGGHPIPASMTAGLLGGNYYYAPLMHSAAAGAALGKMNQYLSYMHPLSQIFLADALRGEAIYNHLIEERGHQQRQELDPEAFSFRRKAGQGKEPKKQL